MSARLPAVAALVFVLGTCASAYAQDQQQRHAESPAQLFEIACSQCHTLAPVQARRDGAEGWRYTVREMVMRGAQLDAGEAEAVTQHLVENFGPAAGPMATGALPAKAVSTTLELPPGEARELVQGTCQVCHDLGRIVSTRRTAGEWKRYTHSMLARGGLVMTEQQIDAVAAYLSTAFGPSRADSVRTAVD